MKVDSHNWTRVSSVNIGLLQSSFGSGSIISVGLINTAFFCANPKCGCFIVRKSKRRDCNFISLIMSRVYQLQRFLCKKKSQPLLGPFATTRFSDLRLRKHIDQPTAHSTICTTCNKVVCILCSDHLHSINWVGVSCSRKWCFENRKMLRSSVP